MLTRSKKKDDMAPPPTNSPLNSVSRKISSSKLTAETKEIFTLLVTLFTTLQSTQESSLQEILNKIERNNNEQNSKISDLQARITSLEERLETVSTTHSRTTRSLQSDIDNNDQYERRDTLILSGPQVPEATAEENPKQIIHELFRRHLNLQIDPSNISIAHRLGRKPSSSPDKRNIIFKLCRRDTVTDIMHSCRLFRNMDGPQPFYVNASLTPLRNKIFYALRMLKKKFPHKISSCSSQNGNIAAYIPSPTSSAPGGPGRVSARGRRYLLNTRQDLDDFVINTLRVSSSDIQVNW